MRRPAPFCEILTPSPTSEVHATEKLRLARVLPSFQLMRAGFSTRTCHKAVAREC